jgi:hypothetical protein
VLLGDLLAVPQLHIRPIFAEGDALERSVGWAYTTDLLNPTRYLTEGQLIMTGLMWRRDAADSELFIDRVASAGATALFAGEGLLGHVPDDVELACRHHGLPLFAVPPDVSFAEITEYIASQAARDRVSRLTASLVRHRQLLAEVAEGKALDDLAHRFSRETGLSSWIISPSGRHLVQGAGSLSDEQVDRLTEAALSASALPTETVAPDRGEPSAFTIFGVGAIDHRAQAWYLVVAGRESTWPSSVRDAVGELAGIAALDRTRQEQRLAEWRQMADNAVIQLEGNPDSADSTLYLRQAGVALDRPIAVAMGDFIGRPDLRDVARAILVDSVANVCTPVVGIGRDRHPVAIIGGREGDADARNAALDPDALLADLRTAIRRVAPGLGEARYAIGVSHPAMLASVGGALRAARFAWMLGESQPDTVHVASSSQMTSALQLMLTVPDHLRRTFAEHVLGPVTDYDKRNDADLVPTLRSYLDLGGSWSRVAAAMNLHINTVRYRIARVEELTGRSLGKIEDRADLFLALQSM